MIAIITVTHPTAKITNARVAVLIDLEKEYSVSAPFYHFNGRKVVQSNPIPSFYFVSN